jgi:DNA-binding CsgD family transcriptional regulator
MLDRVVTRARQAGNPWAEIRALAGVGFWQLTLDRPDDAADALLAADQIAADRRLAEIGWHRMHADLVEALVGCGRLAEAEAVAQAFSERAIAQMPFDRARALLGLGAALRRANRRRAARDALAEAAAQFGDMGATPWAARAAAELSTISGRAAAGSELTAMQHRVAALAVLGRTNAEIAQELFVSVRTVETHLAAVYRKLGARSRT